MLCRSVNVFALYVCSCFLMLEATVLTCFVPAAVLVFINTLIALRICCLLREPRHVTSQRRTPCDDPDTEETHDNEIEVLSSGHSQPDYRSMQSDSPAPSAERPVSELDPVYRPSVQLSAVVCLLLLFCLTWTSAAFVVVPPFEFLHDTVVYQSCYAVSAVVLALFLVSYFCICRSDIRSTCICHRQSSVSESSRWQYVKATDDSASHGSGGKVQENGWAAVCDARGVDESSAVLAVESLSVAAKSLHSDTDHATSVKANGPQFAAPAVAVPECVAFYNARQNGVARKYWERSRKKRAMTNLYHNETGLHHRLADDESKPDGASSSTTPNGNAKSAVNGAHQKLVTAAVENVPAQHVTGLADEQQPLLSVISAATHDHCRTVSCPGSDTGTAHTSAVRRERLSFSDTAVRSVEQCDQTDKLDRDSMQTGVRDGKTSVATAAELCPSDRSAAQRSSSVDTADYESKNIELHSVSDANHLHPADSRNSFENFDVTVEERGITHSPNTGMARAFINKNYCASVPQTSSAERKRDCSNGDIVAEADTLPADIWVRQNSKPVKLKTETSV